MPLQKIKLPGGKGEVVEATIGQYADYFCYDPDGLTNNGVPKFIGCSPSDSLGDILHSPLIKELEEQRATDKREEQKGDLEEHPDGDRGGKA